MIGGLRKLARRVRHSPLLEDCEPLWRVLRGPYRAAIALGARGRGVPVTVGGESIRVRAEFASVGWETVEAESYRAFLAELRADDMLFDVGANIGTYTILAHHRLDERGRIVAFEPDPHAVECLRDHLRWNHCEDRTTIREICCGSARGERAFFHVPGEASGRSGLVPVEGHAERRVDVTTLDEEVERLGAAPTFMKIDVEGGELEVLRGAERVLADHRPRILLSVHPDALSSIGSREDEVLELLRAKGYRLEVLGRDHEIHVMARA